MDAAHAPEAAFAVGTLEFDAVREQLARHTSFSAGREPALHSCRPGEVDQARQTLAVTGEASLDWPVSGLHLGWCTTCALSPNGPGWWRAWTRRASGCGLDCPIGTRLAARIGHPARRNAQPARARRGVPQRSLRPGRGHSGRRRRRWRRLLIRQPCPRAPADRIMRGARLTGDAPDAVDHVLGAVPRCRPDPW